MNLSRVIFKKFFFTSVIHRCIINTEVMNTLMEKMLSLPEFRVTDFKQNDNDMGFYGETKERPTVCPVCGCYKPKGHIN